MEDERRWIESCLAGDSESFRPLVERYQGRVFGLVRRLTGSVEDARELAQEVFLRVFRAAGRYKPKARFTTWLYRIATNVCLNELRKGEYRQQIESLEGSEAEAGSADSVAGENASPETRLQAREREALIRQALSQLPDKQRAAMLLRITGEFSYREIAAQLGCTENHVKILIYRGRQKMKKKLAPLFGEDD